MQAAEAQAWAALAKARGAPSLYAARARQEVGGSMAGPPASAAAQSSSRMDGTGARDSEYQPMGGAGNVGPQHSGYLPTGGTLNAGDERARKERVPASGAAAGGGVTARGDGWAGWAAAQDAPFPGEASGAHCGIASASKASCGAVHAPPCRPRHLVSASCQAHACPTIESARWPC